MVRQNREGFTLVELLVVIVIISMLIGMLVPAVQGARERARQTKCMNNQKQLAMAVLGYEGAKKRFPGYFNVVSRQQSSDPADFDYRSWVVSLLPHVGRNDLWEIYRDGGVSIPNKDVARAYLEFTVCPSNTPETTTGTWLAYAVNCGMVDGAPPNDKQGPNGNGSRSPDFEYNGVFHNRTLLSKSPLEGPVVDVTMTDIKDGAASTLMMSEHLEYVEWSPSVALSDAYAMEPRVGFTWQLASTDAELRAWQINEPEDTLAPNGSPRSNHPAGVLVAFCDGHTQYLRDNIDYRVYQHLMTPDSGEVWIINGKGRNLAGVLSEGDYK